MCGLDRPQILSPCQKREEMSYIQMMGELRLSQDYSKTNHEVE